MFMSSSVNVTPPPPWCCSPSRVANVAFRGWTSSWLHTFHSAGIHENPAASFLLGCRRLLTGLTRVSCSPPSSTAIWGELQQKSRVIDPLIMTNTTVETHGKRSASDLPCPSQTCRPPADLLRRTTESLALYLGLHVESIVCWLLNWHCGFQNRRPEASLHQRDVRLVIFRVLVLRSINLPNSD